jgi:hypothetical protein
MGSAKTPDRSTVMTNEGMMAALAGDRPITNLP